MKQIKIKNQKNEVVGVVEINSNTQISKLGRPFRYSGLRKNLQLQSKWINKIEKWHWIYSFIYLDEQEGFFDVEIDYNDNFVSLTKTTLKCKQQ